MTTVKQLPWMNTAESLLSIKEVAGAGNNPTILTWAKSIGGWIATYYKHDSIPWCGLFTIWCFKDNDINVPLDNPLYSLNWLKFGIKTDPCYGAVMVFTRSGGGHVGFYVSEDAEAYHILGGNQENSVNVTRVSKSRFKGARWPTGLEALQTPGRIKRTFAGKLSVNEA